MRSTVRLHSSWRSWHLRKSFARSPGSTGILFTTKTRRREESQRISSRLRGEIFSVAADFVRCNTLSEGRSDSGCSNVGIPESLAEVISPAFRKRGVLGRATKQLLVLCIHSVKIDDVGDRQAAPLLSCELDGIARGNFALVKYGKIEAGAPALQEAPHDVRPIEPDAELETGHPRLRDHQLSGAHPQTLANPNAPLEQALGREILAEDSPAKVHSGKLAAPIRVVLGRVCVDSLVDSPIHGQVRLPVAFQVDRRHSHSAVGRSLKNGGAYCPPAPLHLSRKTNVHRNQPHGNLTASPCSLRRCNLITLFHKDSNVFFSKERAVGHGASRIRRMESFAFSSRASRLRGESPAQDSPRSREERQEREYFAKKNPFLPAKDFRVGSTDLCPSVFICGFIQPARVWGRARDSTASCSRGNLPGWRP